MADPEYDALLATEYTTYPHEACVIALGHTIENKADAAINDWAEVFFGYGVNCGKVTAIRKASA